MMQLNSIRYIKVFPVTSITNCGYGPGKPLFGLQKFYTLFYKHYLHQYSHVLVVRSFLSSWINSVCELLETMH